MATSRRRSSRRPVFERNSDWEIDASALPRIVVRDGRLDWDLPDDDQGRQTQDASADSTAADSRQAPVTAAEQALIAVTARGSSSSRRCPGAQTSFQLGDLLRIVTRHSGAEIGLSVAGLVLQVAGVVPVLVWESVVTTHDAFSPRWSRTDFEFDLSHYLTR